MVVEILIVLVLTVVNGLLSMSELAVVSARPARLRVLQDQGSRGAATALALAEQPGRFISTVQIGITLVGIIAGAFSGATLGVRLTAWLISIGVSDGLADALGVGLVVVGITYLSLIIGELVPKQIALSNPEAVATRVAPAMRTLSKMALPLVWVLDHSGKLLLRLLGFRGRPKDGVTEEEVRMVITEAATEGVIESEEREMIAGVMRLADRTARALMTPRGEVELIDAGAGRDEIAACVRATRRSLLPVRQGGQDEIVGVVRVRDVFEALLTDPNGIDLRALVQEAPVVADGSGALDVIERIRATTMHMALVFDEYGHFEGIVTSADLLEAITGAFTEEGDEEPDLVQREDGSYLVAGWMPVDEFADRTGISVDRDGDYATVAGFVLECMGRLPAPGESFRTGDWRVEVMDLDGRRVDKVLVQRVG
ncbi:MAG TPA: hemolysin family protein [Paracoccaceae bacterium]|nr:hemolysin family protein [Paracoccaceae bacterium]